VVISGSECRVNKCEEEEDGDGEKQPILHDTVVNDIHTVQQFVSYKCKVSLKQKY
jgi:hypothetical protein